MKNIFAELILSVFVLFISACKEDKAVAINERYPMPWREASHKEFVALGETIVKKGIKVCGEYYIREASGVPGEYLVGCTADGKTWNYYVINAVVSDAVGPIQDSAISNPR